MRAYKFTTVTQLHTENNKQIIDYIENSIKAYARVMRNTFQCIKHKGIQDNSSYNAYLQNTYGITKRTANSIIKEAQGNKTVTDLQQLANRITTLALREGKSIVIENLNFNKTKSETETKRGKKYNEMLHSLAYRKFISLLDYMTYKNNIQLIKVNPAWTSWIAKTKYCPIMKLNTHIGASYVIAKRGQGYSDTAF